MSQEGAYLYDVDRLLAVRPAPGQIKARFYNGFSSYLWQRGENPRDIFEAAGVDPIMAADPDNRLNCAAMANLVEYCGRRLDDPLFGLHLAEQQDADVFGTVMVLARSAPNFRQAINVLIDYLPLTHSPECDLWMNETARTAEIRWASRSDLNSLEQPNYQGSFLMLKAFESLGGKNFKVRSIGLGCAPSARIKALLEERLGCEVYRSDDYIVSLDPATLDAPIPTANSMIFDFLGGYLASARGRTQPNLMTLVQAYVRSALPSGLCTIERCAARLGMSVRVLQKRMSGTGISFWAIVEAERLEFAKKALEEGKESLDEIALSLGYSDQTCFGRAFKRWTGTTPRAFRNTRSPFSGSPTL